MLPTELAASPCHSQRGLGMWRGAGKSRGEPMSDASLKTDIRLVWPAVACALAGAGLFLFFGNATRGYVDTSSTFWWWISQWLDPMAETEHGWLILGISAWLLWRNLRGGRDGSPSRPRAAESFAGSDEGQLMAVPQMEEGSQVQRDGRLGEASLPGAATAVTAMVAALALHAVGFVAQQTRISIVAVLLFAWGVVRLGGGKRWGDAAKFPLAFMLFAIPLNVLDSVGFWLRLWVIDAAGPLARAAGIEVVRSGTQLFAADGRYQYDVAAACSGVRSLMALAALSLLVGYLNFRSGWRRALMLGLCLPLTYIGNVARIVVIIFAAQMGGQEWGERAHDVMGFGVFAIVLGGVLGAAWLLERWWPEERVDGGRRAMAGGRWTVAGGRSGADGGRATQDESERQQPAAGLATWRRGLFTRWAPTLLVIAVTVAEIFFLARVAAAPSRGAAGVRLAADEVNPVELPAFVGTEWIGRRTEVTSIEREILPADTGFSRRTYVNVQDGRRSVFVSLVLSGRDRTSIHRPELCLVGQGWTITGKKEHGFSGARGEVVPATLLRTELIDPRTQQKVPALVAYWFVSSDATVATHWGRFFHDAWNRLRGQADRWAYVLVQTDAVDGEAAALGRMQQVLDGTLPVFQRAD